MTANLSTNEKSVAQVIEEYGKCVELVSMDPHFHDISVGLYIKDGTFTVWSYSGKPGVHERIANIRDQFAVLGGMIPVAGTDNQFRSSCGRVHLRALGFLLAQAVGKSPDFSPPDGGLTIRDTKTKLTLNVTGNITGSEGGEQWVYEVSATGEAPNIPARLRLVVAGFVRYGEMEKVSDHEVAFPCGQRHDELMRILMPYSRNISAVENMMESDALRGQMTTGTLGFTPT
jgi:hypothetical protein